MLSQQSYYDALLICKRLQLTHGAIAPAEVHLFAFLSCLLALYKGKSVSEWGYYFAITSDGYPYSAELNNAISINLQAGNLHGDEDRYLTLSTQGNEELSLLNTLHMCQSRSCYIRGACDATLALPIGIIRTALSQRAEVQNALKLSNTCLLPSEIGLAILYEQFEMLSECLGSSNDDLMVPAVVWLTYLSTETDEGQLGGNAIDPR